MEKLKEYRQTTKIVKEILIDDEYARNDDNYLYAKVLETLAPNMLKKPFWQVLNSISVNDLPSIETVSRCRRKVQEQNETLRPAVRVREARRVNEEKVRFWVTEE